MKLKWGCLSTPRNFERKEATTPLGSSKKIKPKRLDTVVAQTRRTRKAFNDFAEGITIGENFTFIIYPEERDGNLNYVYFVGQVVERAQKWCATGRYRSTWYQKNDWIVKII